MSQLLRASVSATRSPRCPADQELSSPTRTDGSANAALVSVTVRCIYTCVHAVAVSQATRPIHTASEASDKRSRYDL